MEGKKNKESIAGFCQASPSTWLIVSTRTICGDGEEKEKEKTPLSRPFSLPSGQKSN